MEKEGAARVTKLLEFLASANDSQQPNSKIICRSHYLSPLSKLLHLQPDSCKASLKSATTKTITFYSSSSQEAKTTRSSLPPTFVRVARPNPPTPVAIPSKLAPYIQSGDVRCGLDESNKMCCTFPQNFTIPDKLTALSNDFKQKIGKPVQPPHSLTHPKSSSNSQLTPPPSLPPLTSKPIN